MTRRRPGGTATSAFGVGPRESHDASGFYARFAPKELSGDDTLAEPFELREPLRCGDARSMDLPDHSVALVVTSPPYFAGKEYEEALGSGGVPATYVEYLELLRDVFAECRRVLEPGGRIAVNVANLGRRPYRSLSADVVRILDDDLGLLLRGEVVWRKAEGATGSCAWGSYRSATNPVLRDVTERVVVASKGRFDRAPGVDARRALGRPWESTISTDEFLESTLDLWEIRPESARRVGHPAPFPVELPQRLIELYTFRGDLVLDPFLGSGSTAVAAARTGRRYVGYDTEQTYLATARQRLAAERSTYADPTDPADPADLADLADPAQKTRTAADAAHELLAGAGFVGIERDRRVSGLGIAVDLVASDAEGGEWLFDLTGAFTSGQSSAGLQRTEELWAAIGRASVLGAVEEQRGPHRRPLVLLSTGVPRRRSTGDRALRAAGWRCVHDVVALDDEVARERLVAYAKGDHRERPLPGFWAAADLGPG